MHSAPKLSTSPTDMESASSSISSRAAVTECETVRMDSVSEVLRRVSDIAAQRAIGDAELERHIKDTAGRMEAAYAAGNRQEAEGWMQAMYAAIKARSPAAKAAREAEIQRSIDEGVGYFCSEHAVTLARKVG